MQVLSASRKKLRPGDIFVMRYPKHGYLFGRVIFVDRPRGRAPMPGSNLVYVYRGVSPTPRPDARDLSRDNLLIPPAFINRLPWSRGYFRTVASGPLSPDDVLDRHCFYNGKLYGKDTFVDQDGVELDKPFEPCGEWGLNSYESLDDEISDALGIGRAPEWND